MGVKLGHKLEVETFEGKTFEEVEAIRKQREEELRQDERKKKI